MFRNYFCFRYLQQRVTPHPPCLGKSSQSYEIVITQFGYIMFSRIYAQMYSFGPLEASWYKVQQFVPHSCVLLATPYAHDYNV